MDKKLIEEGINYLKAMSQGGLNVPDLSLQVDVPEDHIKEAIKAARQFKDASEKIPTAQVFVPNVKVYRDLVTGKRQVVERVQVELLRDIIVRYAEETESVFTTMLPVRITIKRK